MAGSDGVNLQTEETMSLFTEPGEAVKEMVALAGQVGGQAHLRW